MISYKLAKKLKEIGFPQKGDGFYLGQGHTMEKLGEKIFIPSLLCLVQACKEMYIELKNTDTGNGGAEWEWFGKVRLKDGTDYETRALSSFGLSNLDLLLAHLWLKYNEII